MKTKMNPVIHFEIPGNDLNRMCEFYESAFGWETQRMGPNMGNFVLAFTTESDDNRTPITPGAINGGFFEKNETDKTVKLTIMVDDIKEGIRKVKEAGGTMIQEEPFELPNVGLFASFMDTEGNVMTLYEDFGMKGA